MSACVSRWDFTFNRRLDTRNPFIRNHKHLDFVLGECGVVCQHLFVERELFLFYRFVPLSTSTSSRDRTVLKGILFVVVILRLIGCECLEACFHTTRGDVATVVGSIGEQSRRRWCVLQ